MTRHCIKSNTITILSVLTISVFTILLGQNTLEADSKVKTIAVFPFEVIAKEDTSFIGKGMGRMLCSRIGSDDAIQVKCMDRLPSAYGLDLGGSSMAGKTAGVTELNGVDYILLGSVTIAGTSVSSDAKLVDILRPEQVKFISAAGMGVGDIMQQASTISEKVRAAITGNSGKIGNEESSRAIMNSHFAEQPLQDKIPAAPLKVITEQIQPVAATAISSFGSSTLLIQKLDMEIRGIATSDIDGDGKLDMAVMDNHRISFFTFANNTLVKQGVYDGKYYNSNISIDAFDTNGNGKNELFVTSIGKNNYLKSYIIEWNGREFKPLAEDSEWYFKVVAFHGKDRLIGQQRGHDEVFGSAIYQLEFSGNKIIQQEKIAAGNFAIFGFSPLQKKKSGNSNIMESDSCLWFDKSGFLNLGDARGIIEWKSGQSLGSTALFIEQDKGRDNLKERTYINNRVVTGDINSDGVVEIITVSNSDVAKGYLSGYKKFNQGNIQVMAWKNGLIDDLWKGNPVTGYISDFNVIDMDGDTYPEIVYSVVMDKGVVMSNANSTVFIEKIVARHK